METEEGDHHDASGERRGTRRASDVAKEPTCTKAACVNDDDRNNKLKCHTCKRFVHYRCTGLPVFQLQHFVHTKNYRSFVCESCTSIADHLKTVIPTPPPQDPNKKIADLEKIVKDKQVEVDALAETNRILQAEIHELKDRNAQTDKSHKKEKERISVLQTEASELKNEIAVYAGKIASLESSPKEKSSGDNLTELVTKKLEEVGNNLKKSFLDEVNKNQQQMEERMNELLKKSYAAAAGNAAWSDQTDIESTPTPGLIKIPDFRSIIREEENEKLADESDKKRRACNFIVHGVSETVTSDEAINLLAMKSKSLLTKNTLLTDFSSIVSICFDNLRSS